MRVQPRQPVMACDSRQLWCKMGNRTNRQVNKQGHATWIPPTWGNSLPRSCFLLRGSEGKTANQSHPTNLAVAEVWCCVGHAVGRWLCASPGLHGEWRVCCCARTEPAIPDSLDRWEIRPKPFINQTLCRRTWEGEDMLRSRSLDWTFCHILCHLPSNK